MTIEVLEHPADIGFTVRAATLPALFAEAARALYAVALEPAPIAARESLAVELESDDLPSLLVDFLAELLYLLDAGHFVAERAEVRMTGTAALHAILHGEARDPARHPWRLIVKAVTYHRLEVQQVADEWQATVYLDI